MKSSVIVFPGSNCDRDVAVALEKMHFKYDDSNVRDIYYRVLNAMPKKSKKSKTYSYKNNKNQFKDVLNAMSNTNNVAAFNENNQCISSLGEMWEECDLNICSDRCKDRILKAYDISKQEECKNLVTGMDGERQSGWRTILKLVF